jgi:cephalosporin hydroxylase
MRLLQLLFSRFGFIIKKRRPAIPRSAESAPLEIQPANLMQAIHGKDIYEGFDYLAYPFDPAGWGCESPAFETLIQRVRPKLIIEVGTWKGGSALRMADLLMKNGLAETPVLCVDTWLGALEFWADQTQPDRFLALECKHGYPSVYYRFLANVVHAGHAARITPFPLPATTAALWLRRTNLRADLVYIDGSHEEEDVYQDLLDYAPLVAPGGYLFGDDWAWTGVRDAVTRFSLGSKRPIEHIADKWAIRF